MHICGGAAALLTANALHGCRVERQPLVSFGRVKLVDRQGAPLQRAALEVEQEYVFFYPYVSTPCFLLNLGKATTPVQLRTAAGESYQWPGGIGPDASLVAFAAICAHKLTHPSEAVSFIGYRRQPVGFLNQDNQVVRRGAVIQCCSEHSIYDPAAGARVLSGPAPQPLAGIALEERDGELFAGGVYGGMVYDRFFERFGFRLELEFGERARDLVSGTTAVMTTEEYSRQRVQC